MGNRALPVSFIDVPIVSEPANIYPLRKSLKNWIVGYYYDRHHEFHLLVPQKFEICLNYCLCSRQWLHHNNTCTKPSGYFILTMASIENKKIRRKKVKKSKVSNANNEVALSSPSSSQDSTVQTAPLQDPCPSRRVDDDSHALNGDVQVGNSVLPSISTSSNNILQRLISPKTRALLEFLYCCTTYETSTTFQSTE